MLYQVYTKISKLYQIANNCNRYILCIYLHVSVYCWCVELCTWSIPGISGVQSASVSGSMQCSPQSKLPAEFVCSITQFIECTQIYLFLAARAPDPFIGGFS